jgi:hypothetical protein
VRVIHHPEVPAPAVIIQPVSFDMFTKILTRIYKNAEMLDIRSTVAEFHAEKVGLIPIENFNK